MMAIELESCRTRISNGEIRFSAISFGPCSAMRAACSALVSPSSARFTASGLDRSASQYAASSSSLGTCTALLLCCSSSSLLFRLVFSVAMARPPKRRKQRTTCASEIGM